MKKLFNHTKRPDRNWEEDVQDGYDWDEEEYTGEDDGEEYYADEEEYPEETDGEEYYAENGSTWKNGSLPPQRYRSLPPDVCCRL